MLVFDFCFSSVRFVSGVLVFVCWIGGQACVSLEFLCVQTGMTRMVPMCAHTQECPRMSLQDGMKGLQKRGTYRRRMGDVAKG